MLHSLRKLEGFGLRALDGEIGSVTDFLFDDEKWAVRYLVVNTGGWLSGRTVVISPISVKTVRDEERQIDLILSREHVEESPSIDTQRPVTREMERTYFDYFKWPYYWTGAGVWGVAPEPAGLPIRGAGRGAPARAEADPHLFSAEDVLGYGIEAIDGEFGDVEDFLIEPRSWVIRYLVIDTASWWPSKKTLVSPSWIDSLSWHQRKLRTDLSRATIRSGPFYSPKYPVDREFEEKLHRHYRKRGYWEAGKAA
ncbi:MAG: PRC-barrel domain-containing protein [Oligoflexia bacterium]|nr:PRC-barrel domain-containing protein [Oligoflexia bacterium]